MVTNTLLITSARLLTLWIIIFANNFGCLAAPPEHGGVGLTEWLVRLDGSGSSADRAARNAIHQIGTNALPYLRRLFESKDSKLELKTYEFLKIRVHIDVRFAMAQAKHLQAMMGCVAVGSDAVPTLVEFCEDDNTSGEVRNVWSDEWRAGKLGFGLFTCHPKKRTRLQVNLTFDPPITTTSPMILQLHKPWP